MIAPLVRWEHSEDWYVTMYRVQDKIKSGERNISISIKEDEFEYLTGHVIDGRNLFPATGYLVNIYISMKLLTKIEIILTTKCLRLNEVVLYFCFLPSCTD